MSSLKRVLALSLALMMALSLGVFAADYTDTDDIDASCIEAIDMLVALNILNADGYGDGSFRPSDTITRAQAAKMIYVLCNNGVDDGASVYVGPNTFADTREGAWYEGYIEYCYAVGIIAGRGKDAATGKPVFDPEAPVTGYELAKMLLVVAGYRPLVQGYENDANWQQNITRDARNAELLEGYAILLSAPAPRQWASLMMATLITKVEVAQYIGDLLVTGSGLTGTTKTVGEDRLSLVSIVGTLTQTKYASFSGGWVGEDDANSVSVVTGAVVKGVTGTVSSTWETGNYNPSNALLGKEVKVLAKMKNTTLTGSSAVRDSNLTILTCYATGTTVESTMTLKDFTIAGRDNNGSNSLYDAIRIKFTGYYDNNYRTFNLLNATGRSDWNDFVAKVYGSDYNTIEDLECDWDSSWDNTDYHSFVNQVLDVFKNRADDVILLDDGSSGNDGLTYFVIQDTEYARVSNINATRLNLSGIGSVLIEDVTYDGDAPARGNIVAVTKDYSGAKLVYKIRIIESTTIKATTWTTTTAGVTDSVKLDGTSYKLAGKSASTLLNKDHQLYYLDKGFVVYSSDATEADGSAPEDLGIITNVYAPFAGGTGNSISVQYMNAAGTKTITTYDYNENTSQIGYVSGTATMGQLQTTVFNALKAAYHAGQMVRIDTTSDGVIFYAVDNDTYSLDYDGVYETSTTNVYAGAINSANVQYDHDNQMMKIGSSTYDVGTGASVMARYSRSASEVAADTIGTYTRYTYTTAKVALADLGDFPASGIEADVTGVLINADGVITGVYLDFDTDALPDVSGDDYLVVTGTAYLSGSSYVYVTALMPNGEKQDIRVDKVSVDGGTAVTATQALVNRLQYRMVEYSVSSSKYTLTLTTDGQTANITDINDDGSFKTNRGTFKVDSDTVVYYVSNDDGTAEKLDEVVFCNNGSAYVIASTGSSLVGTAKYVLINADDNNVVTYNITPKAASSVDTTRPELSGAITVIGNTVTINFTENVMWNNILNYEGFTVYVNGVAATITGISGTGTSTLTLTLGTAVLGGQTVVLSYSNANQNITDVAGNRLNSISNTTVANNTGTLPMATPTATPANLVFNTVDITYSTATTGVTYTWTGVNAANGALTTAGSNALLSANASNLSTLAATAGFNAGDKLTCTITRAGYTTESYTFTLTAATTSGASVSISGTAQWADILTANITSAPANGGNVSYKWYYNDGTDHEITGATTNTLTLSTLTWVGKTIKVEVTYSNYSTVVASTATAAVAKAIYSGTASITGAPAILIGWVADSSITLGLTGLPADIATATYVWSNGGGNTIGGTTTNATYIIQSGDTISASTVYQCVISSANYEDITVQFTVPNA